MNIIAPPTHTPWGRPDHYTQLGHGIFFTSTSSHGGIWVSPDLHAKMPAYMRETTYSRSGWFEEDVDWCLPYIYLWHNMTVDSEAERDRRLVTAWRTFMNWHPEVSKRYIAEGGTMPRHVYEILKPELDKLPR